MLNGLCIGGQPAQGLRPQLRYLISQYGMGDVHKELEDIFKVDYAFLSGYFRKEKPKAKQEIPFTPIVEEESGKESSKEPNIIDFMEQQDKKKIHTKGVIVKVSRSAESPMQPMVKKEEEQVQSTVDVLEEEEVNQAKPPFTTTQPPKGLTGNAVKIWQKEQEDKRASVLREEGIDGMTLLTEANLRQWLEKEGRAYAQVARDIAGVSEAIVAQEAKKYGIQSTAAKRRAAIIAMKMKR